MASAQLLLVAACLHQRPVIGVADTDIAFAGRNVARRLAIATGRLLREIGLQAAKPFLGLRLAVLVDHRADQGVVIDVLAGADADLALPFRIGKLFIGDIALLHPILGGIHHARAHRDAIPMTFRVAILRGHYLVEQGGLDRLGDTGLHRVLEPADIDREQHVGWTVGALGLDALFKTGGGRHHIHLDAGVLREGIQHRLDQLVLAIGIDIDLALRGGERRGTDRERTYGNQRTHPIQWHVVLPD